MPHEKINHPRPRVRIMGNSMSAAQPASITFTGAVPLQAVVEWDPIGWVNLAMYPEGWNHTGHAHRVELPPQDLDLLIKTLKRAKRQAYGNGQRYIGYEDVPKHDTEPLWKDRLPHEWSLEPSEAREHREAMRKAVAEDVDESVTDGIASIPPPRFEDPAYEALDAIHKSTYAPGEVKMLDDPWRYDTDGRIRDSLFTIFGIETDEEQVLPTEVMTRLMAHHHLSHDQASAAVWPGLADSTD